MPRPERGVLPFSSERKLMAAFHGTDAGLLASVKGAPIAVLARCGSMRTADGVHRLDSPLRQTLHDLQETLARSGLRMLAVASGPVVEPSEAALA